MNHKKTYEMVYWGLTLLPVLVVCVVFRFLPDKVAAHYNINGIIDRWGSKYEAFIFPLIIILLSFLWLIILGVCEKRIRNAKDDKERKEAVSNLKVTRILMLGVVVYLDVMSFAVLYTMWKSVDYSAMSINPHAGCIIIGCMGLLFMVIGNFMPKCKRNSTIGLRTVWSMDNDEAWALSQRYGGRLFLASGVVVVLCSLTGSQKLATGAVIAVLLCDLVLSVWISYVAYKKSKSRRN